MIFNIKNPPKFLIPIYLTVLKKMNSKCLLLFTFLREKKRKKKKGNRLSVLTSDHNHIDYDR